MNLPSICMFYVLCASVHSPSSTSQSLTSHAKWIARHRLIVPFVINDGGLAICADGEQFVDPEVRRLCFVDAEGRTPITSLSQLKGRVRIDTAPKALAFVRLRTYVDCWDSFNPRELEIVTPNQFDRQFVFNDERKLEFLNGVAREITANNLMPGYAGIIPSSIARARHFPKPIVKATLGGYEITRAVIEFTQSATNVVALMVREHVGPNGSYLRLNSRPLGVDSRGIHFEFPRSD